MHGYRFSGIAVVIILIVPEIGLAADEGYQLPEWFDGNRVQAHTRLGPKYFKDPVFFSTAERFEKMGVEVYTRHAKSGKEACWWPSKVGECLPEAKDFNIAKKMIDNAHARGMRMIGYYWHMADQAMAEEHPEWACRTEEGQTIPGKRGLWMCLNTGFREFTKTRLLELVDMGVDGIYFDTVHMPAGFPNTSTCYCKTCQQKFKEIYAYRMPSKYSPFDVESKPLVDFYNRCIIEIFEEFKTAVHQRNPECVLVISTTWSASMYKPLMPSRFVAVADSAKTEWNKAYAWPKDKHIPKDVLKPAQDMRWAAGFTYLRGACSDRPLHVWANFPWITEEVLSISSACMTYGLIANLDVKEAEIPNMAFKPAFELGRKVSPHLARTKPMRWAAIHYNERLRDRLWPDVEKIWKAVLWPAYGPFEALCRARLPVAYVTDWQLEAGQLDGYKILILPSANHLTAAQQKQVANFESAGGIVIKVTPDTQFHDPEKHDDYVTSFLKNLLQVAPKPPIIVTGGPKDLHAVAWEKTSARQTTVTLLNSFTWFIMHNRKSKKAKDHPELISSPPPPAQNVMITLRSEGSPKKVFDAVTGNELKFQKAENGWQVKVPEFPFMAAVVFEW